MTSDPFENLPLGKLQSCLPEDVLEEFDHFYRTVVEPDKEYDKPSIWSDRQTLASLYKATNLDGVMRSQERKEILSYQPRKELESVASSCGIDASEADDIDSICSNLADIPWVRSNPDAVAISEYLGLPKEIIPPEEIERESERVISPPAIPHKSLMIYQLEAANELEGSISTPNARALLQMPTGSGKTRVATEVLARFLKAREGNNRLLWLAHVRELCYQAADAFEETWSHVGDEDLPIYIVEGDTGLPDELPDPCLVVGGLQKLRSILRREGDLPQFDLVVIDEAHKAVAPTYEQVILESMALGGRLLGLTATPGRALEDDPENREVANLFRQNLVTIEPPDRELGVIEWLQQRKILSKVIREPLEVDPKIKVEAEDVEHIADRGDFSADFLARLAMDRHRNEVIIRKLLELGEKDYQTIVFATSLDQSRLLTSILVANGYRAVHIDGSTPRSVRDYSTRRFKSGEVQFLLNYNVFSTGFDAPDTNCVFIARPTLSIVLYSQMIGRGLRGPMLGGNDRCLILDVVDNIETFSRDLDQIYGFFDDYWVD